MSKPIVRFLHKENGAESAEVAVLLAMVVVVLLIAFGALLLEVALLFADSVGAVDG